MKFVNTKINAADFPRLYPHLFTSYQVLMRATLERVNRVSQEIVARFDGEVQAALSLCTQQEAAANQVFNEATAAALAQVNETCAQADRDLNAAFPRLLEEKDAAQKPLRQVRDEQFYAKQSDVLAGQACLRELGLPDQGRAVFEQFQADVSVYMAEADALIQPAEKEYQRKLKAAFDLRNETVRVAQSQYQQYIDPYALDCKRAIRFAQSTKQNTLEEIPWRRDEAQEELRAFISGSKQERLQFIESFLQSGDEEELQQRLEFACSNLSRS